MEKREPHHQSRLTGVLLGSIGRSEDGVLCERDYGQRISPIGFDKRPRSNHRSEDSHRMRL